MTTEGLFPSDLWQREPIRGQMFIWAYWDDIKQTWASGLGYWNVSGGWSDAYGRPPRQADWFHPMPEPPRG